MEPLYLVDGSGYIYRAYYAVRPLSNAAGLPTNALFGYTQMMLKLLSDVGAKYIAVTFDTPTPTFRHVRFDQYKANRKECPEDLVPQMPYFRKVTQALGIKCLEKPGFEADDIIATICKRAETTGQQVVIVSGDKDLTQLVNDNIQMWDAMRDIRYTPDLVKEKFGVWPNQIGDYLALTGDSSDNIPGVPGIGPKTAAQLIEEFKSLDGLVQDLPKLAQMKGIRGAKSLKDKIESNLDVLNLSKELVALDSQVEPFNQHADVEDYCWQGLDKEFAVALFHELEFEAILNRLELSAPKQTEMLITERKTNPNYKIVDEQSLAGFVEKLAQVKEFAFDTETTGLDIRTIELVGISISWEPHIAYYLPVASVDGSFKGISLDKILQSLSPIFADCAVAKRGFNLKYDISVLEQNGFKVRGAMNDAMIAWSLLHPDSKRQGLKALVKEYLHEEMTTYAQVTAGYENISQVPLEQVKDYAAHDADASWRLCEFLNKPLEEEGELSRTFHEVEMPLIAVLSRMERNGVKIDDEFLKQLSGEFGNDLKKLEQEIYNFAGHEFNINSPKQLGTVLFEELKLPTTGVKKTNLGYSTDASVLYRLAEHYQIVSCLLDYRELHKLLTTYVDALVGLIHPKTGRIHSSFNQANTATGRLSSSDPNLQNIPIRNERGRLLRKAFIAEKGNVLIKADYSQIELRILAHICEDENLTRAFLSDQDIHLATAIDIFGKDALDPKRQAEFRRYAKTINFGLIYGMGAFRLARELSIPRADAQHYIDDYFARYPKVKEYFAKLEMQIETEGYVETMFGRRRYKKDIDSSDRDKGYMLRSLNNTPIQGSAAEVIKIAMVNVANKLERFGSEARLIMQVHDELVFEVKESVLPEVKPIIIEEMEGAVKLRVPLKVDVSVGSSWG